MHSRGARLPYVSPADVDDPSEAQAANLEALKRRALELSVGASSLAPGAGATPHWGSVLRTVLTLAPVQ